jgi:hypothetical protein
MENAAAPSSWAGSGEMHLDLLIRVLKAWPGDSRCLTEAYARSLVGGIVALYLDELVPDRAGKSASLALCRRRGFPKYRFQPSGQCWGIVVSARPCRRDGCAAQGPALAIPATFEMPIRERSNTRGYQRLSAAAHGRLALAPGGFEPR